jgi:hypothetical protein
MVVAFFVFPVQYTLPISQLAFHQAGIYLQHLLMAHRGIVGYLRSLLVAVASTGRFPGKVFASNGNVGFPAKAALVSVLS